MKSIKILILLTNQPLTKHNFTRLGVGKTYKGWKIKYLSILPIINRKIYEDYTKKGSRHIKDKNFKEIFSYFNLFNELKKLPKNFFYSNQAGHGFLASIIDRAFYILGGRKISFIPQDEINLDIYTTKRLKSYFNKNNLPKLILRSFFTFFKKIFEFLSSKIASTQIKLIFVFNNNSYEKIKKKYKKISIVKAASPELELYVKAKKNKDKHLSDIVFIDDVVEDSFDYKLGYMQDKNRRFGDYWGPTKDFLNYIKYHFPQKKIYIAAHHRRNERDIPINGFKFFFDKTSKLIKDSKLVLCHNSFACQIAVLFKKPIIFLTSNYYQKYHYHSHALTIELSKALGTQLIHIGKNFNKNPSVLKKIKNAKINFTKYEQYRRNYIQFNDLKINDRWQNILKNLEKNKSQIF